MNSKKDMVLHMTVFTGPDPLLDRNPTINLCVCMYIEMQRGENKKGLNTTYVHAAE
jgi:hypothetical protein